LTSSPIPLVQGIVCQHINVAEHAFHILSRN
jgi:hypothetical protein